MRWLILLPLLAGCASVPPPAGPGCALTRLGQVSLDVAAGVPVVVAQIGGLPARLLLDTGAGTTVVAPHVARRLGLRPTGAQVTMFGAAGRITATPVLLPSVRLGDAAVRAVPALIERALDVAPDGTLGVNLLSAFEIDLDMPNRVATLYAPRRCGGLTPPWAERYTQLPAWRVAEGQLAVPIAVNGVELSAALDTGASVTFLTPRAAMRAGLGALIVDAAPAGRVQAANGAPAGLRRVQVDRFTVGTTTLRNPVLQVGDLPDAVGDGLLGGDYLATHRVWLALAAGVVFVADGP